MTAEMRGCLEIANISTTCLLFVSIMAKFMAKKSPKFGKKKPPNVSKKNKVSKDTEKKPKFVSWRKKEGRKTATQES